MQVTIINRHVVRVGRKAYHATLEVRQDEITNKAQFVVRVLTKRTEETYTFYNCRVAHQMWCDWCTTIDMCYAPQAA